MCVGSAPIWTHDTLQEALDALEAMKFVFYRASTASFATPFHALAQTETLFATSQDLHALDVEPVEKSFHADCTLNIYLRH